jgi:hypothetical protein
MITRLKLKPGQRGTKRLLAEHGDALVCVRYRYDESRKKRLKTIELVIEESDWQPPKPKFRDDDLVSVQIGFSDKELREAAKAARGRWDPEAKLWSFRYMNVKGTKLEKHIILDAFPNKART